MAGSGMKKNVALIMVITILSKLIGFMREIALTYFYGASDVSDVYLISQTIPSALFALIGIGIATSYVPVFNKVRKESGEKAADEFTSNMINIVLVIATVIVAGVLLFTSQIVRVFASGFEGETLRLAVSFTRVSVVGVYFTGIILVLKAYLQIGNNFWVPAMLGIPMNFVMITSFYLASNRNVMILAYGIVLSIVVQLLVLIPPLMSTRFRYKPILDFTNRHVKEILILAIPTIVGVSVNQINILVDRNLASNLAIGGISALNYANKLNGFIQGIFVAPISIVIYPAISRMFVDLNFKGLSRTINQSLVTISLLVIPATAGAIVLARPIVEMLFLRGEFDDTAVEMTTMALRYYSIGMIPFSFRDILMRVYYSMRDTKTPMINASIGVGINVVLNLILSSFMGLGGLALATSISSIVITILILRDMKKKINEFQLEEFLGKVVRITAASLIMAFVAHVGFRSLDSYLSQNVALVIAIIAGAGVYAVIITLLKIEEVSSMIRMLTSTFTRLKK